MTHLSDTERSQPALFLATAVTDPALAGQHAGALIAWRTLGYAVVAPAPPASSPGAAVR